MVKRVKLFFLGTASLILAIGFAFPLLMVCAGSLMTPTELNQITSMQGAVLRLIPRRISLGQYYDLLFVKNQYLRMFINSMLVSISITAGHCIVASVMGFVFAKVRFRGRDTWFTVYVIVMLMPFQVTLLPNYILVRALNLYDTYWALILPAVFSPFGVFMMRQFILTVPDEFKDAAELETNSFIQVLIYVMLPSVFPGLIAMTMLVFADAWNMVEQPMILLSSEALKPLSVAWNSLQGAATDIAFAGSVFTMLPIVVMYVFFEEYLIEGLSIMGV